MPKFVVYEVWTRARVIEAKDVNEAYSVGEPEGDVTGFGDIHLSNWHVVEVEGGDDED